MIVSCLAVLVYFAFSRGIADFNQPVAVYGYGLAMAVFSTVIPAFMLAAAIARIGTSHTSIIGMVGLMATIGLAAIFLAEPMSALQCLGAALVIVGVYWLGRACGCKHRHDVSTLMGN